jgi:hypothetical protein
VSSHLTHPSRETCPGRLFVSALYLVLLGLLAIPIASVVVPPLGDYPNHLARMHILAAYAHSPELRTHYVVAWKLTPYLAMDLIVPQLARFMSIYTAGRVFLVVCLLQFVLGTLAVNAALYRRLSAWPAVSGMFAYNFVVSLGFVNYLFGIGIWLLAFAGWIVLSRGEARWRIIGGSLLSLAVFFSHFFAFAGFFLCVSSYELGAFLSMPDRDPVTFLRRAAVALCPFIVPMCILFVTGGDQAGGMTRYGTAFDKLTALLSPLLFPGARSGLVTLALAAILGVAILLLVNRRLLGTLELAKPMRVPLIVLGLAAIAMPNRLAGVWGMDLRFPIVALFLLIASCAWRNVPTRVTLSLISVMVAVLAGNTGIIIWAWRPMGQQFDEFRSALVTIPPGARVIAFHEDDGIDPSLLRGPFYLYAQLPALAIIERDAYMPLLFRNPMLPVDTVARLPISDTPVGSTIGLPDLIESADPAKGPAMPEGPGGIGMRNYWVAWPRHYDYAVELNFGARPVLPLQLERLASGRIFGIYRIKR